MAEITYTGNLTVIGCGHCHMQHAVPQAFLDDRERDGKTFWCPAGHKMSYGDGETERLRRRLSSAEAQLTHERDQRQAAERSATAYKGRVTRLKNRAAAGVCPCCTRTFQNVQRHMATQHPDFPASEAESPRASCPECGRGIMVNASGLLRHHRASSGRPCKGSRKPPGSTR